ASARTSRSVLSLTDTSALRIGTTSRSRYSEGSMRGPAMVAPSVVRVCGGCFGKIDLALGDAPDHVDQQSALDGFDALMQRVLSVCGIDRHSLLREDGT